MISDKLLLRSDLAALRWAVTVPGEIGDEVLRLMKADVGDEYGAETGGEGSGDPSIGGL